MTFNQRYYRSALPPLSLLVERLHREHSTVYAEICDMISIPRDLRAALLANVIAQGYATDEGAGRVYLTAQGIALAEAARATEARNMPVPRRTPTRQPADTTSLPAAPPQ